MLIITIFPVSIQIKKEQQKLSDRIAIGTTLYDELQQRVWSTTFTTPFSFERKTKNKHLYFQFTSTNNLLKGCVEWTNVKQEKEKQCLFGYPE